MQTSQRAQPIKVFENHQLVGQPRRTPPKRHDTRLMDSQRLEKHLVNYTTTSLRELFVKAKTPCDIPNELGYLTNLVKRGLYDNFVNSIPSQLGNIGDLQCLYIVDTKVSGTIPSALCRLTRLMDLSFANSRKLSGRLPQEFSNFGVPEPHRPCLFASTDQRCIGRNMESTTRQRMVQ